jgi:alkylhydroperoxidase family enzyme
VLREAVDAGLIVVFESAVHERESAPRPDLGLLELLRTLSRGAMLPPPDARSRRIRRRMADVIRREHLTRAPRPSDTADLDAMAVAVRQCDIVTCDAFMADVMRRLRLDVRERCEIFTGRRADVLLLRDRLARLTA